MDLTCRASVPFAATAVLACILTAPLPAQEQELTPPPTWQLRLDNPATASVEDIWYVDMPPGWHITTGPAAILWDPANTASGDFRIESESFLFDPEGRREGFGIFFGGTWTCSPVFGFRPVRSPRWRIRKEPNPRSSTFSSR